VSPRSPEVNAQPVPGVKRRDTAELGMLQGSMTVLITQGARTECGPASAGKRVAGPLAVRTAAMVDGTRGVSAGSGLR